MPIINDVIKESACDYAELDALAVTIGPGAFTGIRIGLSTAKAIGMVIDKPVIGVPSFQAFLETYLNQNIEREYSGYCVAIDTKRKDYYVQCYDASFNPDGEPIINTFEVLEGYIKEGDVALISDNMNEMQEFPPNVYHIKSPEIRCIAKHAVTRLENFPDDASYNNPKPIYMRQPEIGVPKKPFRVME